MFHVYLTRNLNHLYVEDDKYYRCNLSDVKFVITEDDLKFYNSELHYVYEPGEFDVMVGPNSRDVQTKRFQAKYNNL